MLGSQHLGPGAPAIARLGLARTGWLRNILLGSSLGRCMTPAAKRASGPALPTSRPLPPIFLWPCSPCPQSCEDFLVGRTFNNPVYLSVIHLRVCLLLLGRRFGSLKPFFPTPPRNLFRPGHSPHPILSSFHCLYSLIFKGRETCEVAVLVVLLCFNSSFFFRFTPISLRRSSIFLQQLFGRNLSAPKLQLLQRCNKASILQAE